MPSLRRRIIVTALLAGAALAAFAASRFLAAYPPVAARKEALDAGEGLPWAGTARVRVVMQAGETLVAGLPLWLGFALACAAAAPWLPAERLSRFLASPRAGWGAVFFAACALGATVAIAKGVYNSLPYDLDENVYTFQARIFEHGALSARMLDAASDDWVVFFKGPTEVVTRGRWFTMYPPLHPLLLAAGDKITAIWVVGPVLTAGAVAAAFATARRLYGGATAWAAGALLVTSPLLLFYGASRYSEPSFLFFISIFLWFAVRSGETGRRRDYALAGVFAGLALQVREMATVQMAAAPVIYLIAAPGPRRRWERAAWLAGFALLAVAPEFAYNAAVAGSPFRFPRFMAEVGHFSPASLPFSIRLSRFAWQIQLFANDLWGWPLVSFLPALLFPLVARPWRGWDAVWYATFFLVPATNLLMGYHGVFFGPRYCCLSVVPGAFLTARFFAALGAGGKRPSALKSRLAWGVFAGAVVFAAAFYLPRAAAIYHPTPPTSTAWLRDEAPAALTEGGVTRGVVFLTPRAFFGAPMPNDVAFNDNIIYARDFGRANIRLMALFPDRPYFLLDYDRAQLGLPAVTPLVRSLVGNLASPMDDPEYAAEVEKMRSAAAR